MVMKPRGLRHAAPQVPHFTCAPSRPLPQPRQNVSRKDHRVQERIRGPEAWKQSAPSFHWEGDPFHPNKHPKNHSNMSHLNMQPWRSFVTGIKEELKIKRCTRHVSSVASASLRTHGPLHARLPCPSPTPRAYSNSCPLSWWCHPTISFSVIPFSSCLRSFPESGSFQMSQFFASSGQSIGVSTSASVLPMNIRDWFPLGWTGWISLQCKGLSRVFSNTTVQKHQLFSTQPSL